VTVEHIIDFLWESGARVDTFWANRFMGRDVATLPVHQATFLEGDRHKAVVDGIKRYFDCAKSRLRTVPSMAAWNADQTRFGPTKKRQVPILIISASTRSEIITPRENRDHPQLTLLTAISALGDSISGLFLSKTETFEKN
jgi:hypothetical protein